MAEWRVDPAPFPANAREFIELRYRLYARDPLFVPPLRSEEKRLLDVRANPFWRHATIDSFLLRGPRGRAVGRIA